MKNRIIAVVYILANAIISYLLAGVLNGFLGISFTAKELPVESNLKVDTTAHKELPLRLIDMGGVGILPDTANWGSSYSHNVNRFEDVILGEAPFIHAEHFGRVKQEWQTYIERMQRFDFNGVIFHSFLEFTLFNKVGNGYEIYPEGDLYRQRHQVLRDSFNVLFKYAHEKGLKVYLYTDMVAFTPLLKNYLNKRFGKIDVMNKEFWEVYQAGLSELFEDLAIDGIVIRIGEAGAVYNKKDWDYSSELLVRNDEAVQMMLNSFLQTAEKHNKLIIFRTWSVGIGKIGDMHTNPATYQRVLSSIQSPNLVVSTKYCKGDFDSYLPFNPTLLQGQHRRITEMQGRREFEAFNSIPDYVAPLYQQALQEFSRKNPNFEGAWLWTQEGGPLRAGPLAIYPFHGFNVFTDANVYAISRLIKNPEEDLKIITADWIRENFGSDSSLIATLTEFLLKSHEVTQKGLYIKEYAQWDVRALGLEPPPMLWIFKWDIVGGSSSVFSNIYFISKDNLQSAIDEGYEALKGAQQLKQLALAVKDKVSMNTKNYDLLLQSVDYQINLFETLALYRHYILTYYQWLDTGNDETKAIWQEKLAEFKLKHAEHIEKYGKNLDFPAYNFDEAMRGIGIANNTKMVGNFSYLMFVLILLTFIGGLPVLQRTKRFYPMKALGAIIYRTFVNPTAAYTQRTGFCKPLVGMIWIEVLIMGSILIFTSAVAPVFFWVMQTSLIIYMLTIALLNHKTFYQKSIEYAGILSPILMIMLVLMAISAYRNPMFFWMQFWINENFRLVFLLIFVLLITWSYFVLYHRIKILGNISGIRAVFQIFVIQGIQFLFFGTLTALAGLEKSITIWNDEMVVLPGGLSRILGITTHLGIPTNIPQYLLYAAFAFLLLGILGLILKKK